jgi:hypothetical protein
LRPDMPGSSLALHYLITCVESLVYSADPARSYEPALPVTTSRYALLEFIARYRKFDSISRRYASVALLKARTSSI